MCVSIIGAITGTAADIRAAGKVLDALEMSEDEAAEAKIYQNPDGTLGWGNPDVQWDVLDKLDKPALALLSKTVAGFTGWAARDRKRVDALLSKLES